tara:strand:+ start:212 stop:538 length:327 start_codon:yes stop_codon:yes gene_type:complete
MFKLPSLTELFFGKGVDPATYAPSYLSGKGKKQKKEDDKYVGYEDAIKNSNAYKNAKTKKPIKEVQPKAPKNAKTEEKTRGTRKDYAANEKLKEVKKKSTANYRAGKI